MARQLRFQYPGAIYHVMARGDGGKVVFETDDDRKAFVFRLAQVCESHGWRIHAWVLIGNHFHLLLETPQANLVSGMKYLMGTFSQGWNRARLRRGRRAYVAWLEARAANEQGKIDEVAMKAIRRGWYLGKETFRDRLMRLMDKAAGKAASGRTRTGEEIRDHGEKEAVRMLKAGLKELGLPIGASVLAKLPKSDERKILLALILHKRTTVSNDWIAIRLSMGHPGSVSRMISAGRTDRNMSERFHALDKAINNLADPP